jgi:hypothetical protein
MTDAEWDALKQKMQDELLMTTHEAREPHVPAAELDRLRAELAECRRLMQRHQMLRGYCPECGMSVRKEHRPDCAWQKAMGEA